jgi:SAM-dependent methyltransferase
MSGESPRLGLVVPVFDEAARLADYGKVLVDYVAERPGGGEVLFVDDGSGDGTPDLIAAMLAELPGAPARLLRRPHAGKGAAVAAGLGALDAPLLGFCDLDLSTPLEDLERIGRVAVRTGGLAVGSRDLATSMVARPESPWREALGRAYNRLLQATVTPGVVDTQCGAKVADREVWDALLPWCRERGLAWDAEVIAVALARDVPVTEVPVTWRHDDRSKVRLGRDGAAMVAATSRIWRSARRAALDGAGDRSRVPPASAPADTAQEVFDHDNATALAGADRTHWWFRSKAAVVATALRRTRPAAAAPGWLVDLGGGAGGVTSMLGWPLDRAAVLEGSPVLAGEARRRGLTAVRASVHRVPLAPGAAEVVCLLDVIEHLHEPVGALREAGRVLAPGGLLVVTVPAHRWLWSAADVELGHVRRYTRRLLREHLAAAGFEPVVLTHVFSWLVPPVWATRTRARDRAELGLDRTSAAIDRAAMALTWGERALVGRMPVPFGTSVLCVARRAAVHPAPTSSPTPSPAR